MAWLDVLVESSLRSSWQRLMIRSDVVATQRLRRRCSKEIHRLEENNESVEIQNRKDKLNLCHIRLPASPFSFDSIESLSLLSDSIKTLSLPRSRRVNLQLFERMNAAGRNGMEDCVDMVNILKESLKADSSEPPPRVLMATIRNTHCMPELAAKCGMKDFAMPAFVAE